MKLPDAPSSITGFFLYESPDFFHEIDIELYNQEYGDVFFTVYAEGIKQHTITVAPGFDPVADFHVYRIEYFEDDVSFFIDDILFCQWSDGLPSGDMYLMLNVWYPEWLAGIPQETDCRLQVDWIRY